MVWFAARRLNEAAMRILLLINPISGRGRAGPRADATAAVLRDAGHEVEILHTRIEPPDRWLTEPARGADLLVVLGGDGAVRLAAGPAGAAGTPIYHLPYGTENLFARQWGKGRSVDELLRAVEHGRTVRIDMGRAAAEPFLLMVSIGIDADVVADLAAHRRGAITHLSYAMPILRQVIGGKPPVLDVVVDGTPVVEATRGCVVVGNSRQYARRFDPAMRADMSDGLLDVVFFPAGGVLSMIRWAYKSRRRTHVKDANLVYERGASVQIRTDRPAHFQVDGDVGPAPCTELRVRIEPSVVEVLLPSETATERRSDEGMDGPGS